MNLPSQKWLEGTGLIVLILTAIVFMFIGQSFFSFLSGIIVPIFGYYGKEWLDKYK